MPPRRAVKALNPETESQRLEVANDLKNNDDFLASILVDTFGTEEDSLMGVHYQSADFESRRPDIDRQEIFRIVRETVVQNDMTQGIIEMMRVPAFEKYCEEKLGSDKARIKAFQEHLKRYLSLYSPKCRVEIKMTDRYSWHTGHPELGIVATRDLFPLSGTSSFSHRLRWGRALVDDNEPWDKSERRAKRTRQGNTDPVLTELTGGLAQLPWTMRKDIDDLDPHEYYNEPELAVDLEVPLDLDASLDPEASLDCPSVADGSNSDATPAGPRAADPPEEEVKMRDFSIVQSSRYGTMLFLGPGRFLNHDCEPNVKLSASSTRSKNMTFKVIKPIRIGEEIYTYYGPNYFGPNNRECLCLTCEKNGRGVFAPKSEEASGAAVSLRETFQNIALDGPSDPPSVRSSMHPSIRQSARPDSPLALKVGASSPTPMDPQGSDSVDVNSDAEGGETQHSASQARAVMKVVNRRPDSMLLRLNPSELTEEEKEHLRKVKGKGKASVTPVKRIPAPLVFREESTTPSRNIIAWQPPEDFVDASPSRDRDRLRRAAQINAEEVMATMIHDPWQRGRRLGKRMSMLNQSEREDNESRAASSFVGEEDAVEDWSAARCTTCLVSCDTLIQIGEFSVPLCARCTRHHRIFRYPWPAKSRAEVCKLPPKHVRPPWWKANRRDLVHRNNYMAGIDQEERALLQIARREKRREPSITPGLPPETSEERAARLALLAEERAAELITAQDTFDYDLSAARDVLDGILHEEEAAKKAAESTPKLIKGSSLWRRYEYVEIVDEPQPDITAYAGRTRRGRNFRDGGQSDSSSVLPTASASRLNANSTFKQSAEATQPKEDRLSGGPKRRGRLPKRSLTDSQRNASQGDAPSKFGDGARMSPPTASQDGTPQSDFLVPAITQGGQHVSSPSEVDDAKAFPEDRSTSSLEGTASSLRNTEGILRNDDAASASPSKSASNVSVRTSRSGPLSNPAVRESTSTHRRVTASTPKSPSTASIGTSGTKPLNIPAAPAYTPTHHDKGPRPKLSGVKSSSNGSLPIPKSKSSSTIAVKDAIRAAQQEQAIFPTSKAREDGDAPKVILDPISDTLRTTEDGPKKRKRDSEKKSGTVTDTHSGTSNKRSRIDGPLRSAAEPASDFFSAPALGSASSSGSGAGMEITSVRSVGRNMKTTPGLEPSEKRSSKAKPSRPSDAHSVIDLTTPSDESFPIPIKGAGSSRCKALPPIDLTTPSEDSFPIKAATSARSKGLSSASSISPRQVNLSAPQVRGTNCDNAIVLEQTPEPPSPKYHGSGKPIPHRKRMSQVPSPVSKHGGTSISNSRRVVNLKDFHKRPGQNMSTDSPAVGAQAAKINTRIPGSEDTIGDVRIGGEEEVNAMFVGSRRGSRIVTKPPESVSADYESSGRISHQSHDCNALATGSSTPRKRKADRPPSSRTDRPLVDEGDDDIGDPTSPDRDKRFKAAWAALRGKGVPARPSAAAIAVAAMARSSGKDSTKALPLSACVAVNLEAVRCAEISKEIYKNWGCNPAQALGPSLQPTTYSAQFLKALCDLTYHFPSPAKAPIVLQALQSEMDQRITFSDREVLPGLTLEDIENVLSGCQCATCRECRTVAGKSSSGGSDSFQRPLDPTSLIKQRAQRVPDLASNQWPSRPNARSLAPHTVPSPHKTYITPSSHMNHFHSSSVAPPATPNPMALGLLGARNAFQRKRPWAQRNVGSDP